MLYFKHREAHRTLTNAKWSYSNVLLEQYLIRKSVQKSRTLLGLDEPRHKTSAFRIEQISN